jgi:predicted nucleic acid-binding protein
MPESVIADTSALIALEKIGLSTLLCEMYSEIFLPDAVVKEYGIPDFSCFSVKKVQSNLTILLLQDMNLGQGESEVIVLAYQTGIKAIIDDMKARKVARKLKLPITGTVGVLLKAENLSLIPSAYNKAKELQRKGFYVSDKILNDILRFSNMLKQDGEQHI